LFVEHDPVITISQRRESAQHLLASPHRLAQLGIDVQPTDRGGDITYHGPGQLVAYPILRLNDFGLSLSRYMRMLERVVIDTIAEFGVEGVTMEGATGVWVHREVADSRAKPQAAKICAMGVRIRRGVTMHGLALNVTTDLSHFDTIVPCGLTGGAVTSLQQILGRAVPPMATVKQTLARVLGARLGSQPVTAPPPAR
jgi:lipoyl(octanoyl) transferase